MSLARPLARAYSSFFSSKPGGGRHFVSAKPPKPVLHHRRAPVNAENATPTESATPPSNASNVVKPTAPDQPKPSSKPVEALPQASPTVPLLSTSSPPFMPAVPVPIHPALSSKEYKLHQFFSLHRPLLFLNQPTSAIFEAADPAVPLFSCEGQPGNDPRGPFATIDNPPESSPDADADAARQLAHTLVASRVGGAIAWQHALSRLGFTTKYSENDLALAKETAQEWVTIHADSTRRKKRKKMKKHKLKKRRRLTRRQHK